MLVILWLVVWASLISAVKHGTSTRTRGRGIFTTIKSQCIHRDFKYVDCNYCTCYAGYWVCTRRVCETEDGKFLLSFSNRLKKNPITTGSYPSDRWTSGCNLLTVLATCFKYSSSSSVASNMYDDD
ncbi:uncharacterized protein LOC113500156 isoform X1 [Trichoplusia ni]|uniref:Uncharacterized protein LOC113500156 isoform X1 n=1 Tax=Trichoplusia ni TaxID=7111 RepID=A0A7E5W7Q2_TRINI|nr:uncharacterized protein LOC113500156 isoform X1 [Trichoplusia ni]